jgi:hypothetical protein
MKQLYKCWLHGRLSFNSGAFFVDSVSATSVSRKRMWYNPDVSTLKSGKAGTELSVYEPMKVFPMGIDIFATWKGQTKQEQKQQHDNIFSIDAGGRGYLREAYHGGPYATKVLLPELWQDNIDPMEGVPIPAHMLRERLGPTLSAALMRQTKVYQESADSDVTRQVCGSFKAFVELCAAKEAVTGEPCIIKGSY